jgi:uncharacterized protein YfiM (DUF2279 family)
MMINIALALTLLLSPAQTLAVQPRLTPYQAQTDAWFGEDKFKHTFLSVATVAFANAGARLVGLDDTAALAFSVGAGATAALAKEFYDRRKGGPFSVRDLTWDALGIALGAVLVAQTRE